MKILRFARRPLRRRSYSTRSNTPTPEDPGRVRNIALVAHIDSGKTTLTESILHASSYLSVPGTVDTGSTATDFLPAERERGITIQAASIPVHWKNWVFNLIDTPGHADFGMEVESASRVVDGAVILIDSVEGVEPQTRGVWKQLDRYNVPTRLVFLNKLDRPGASFASSFMSLLAHRFHPKPVALTLPVASFNTHSYERGEPGIKGLVDLINWDIWKWRGSEYSKLPLPRTLEGLQASQIFPPSHPMIQHLVEARIALLDTLSGLSDTIFDRLVESSAQGVSSYLTLSAQELIPALRSLVLSSAILPVLCGSAFHHIGTSLLLNYIGHLFASPIDRVVPGTLRKVESLQMLAWKVIWDKKKGWTTYVRIYAGTLMPQSSLYNQTRHQKERASKLLLLYAAEHKEVDRLTFGSVGVVLGLKYTRTGDTLVSGSNLADSTALLPDIKPPAAVIAASVIPHSHADLQPVQDALYSLQRTDPSVRIETQEGQTLVYGLGALHLEIVEGRLRDEWGVQFEFGKRRVGYREGYAGKPTTIHGISPVTLNGRSWSVKLDLEVSCLHPSEDADDAWGENVVLDPTGAPLPMPDANPPSSSALSFLAQGIQTCLSNSPHSALPMTRMRIRVVQWTLPPALSETALMHVTSTILRNHLRDQGIGPILEPFVRVQVDAGGDVVGKVIKDLTEHGGEIMGLAGSTDSAGVEAEADPYPSDGLYIPPEWLTPCSSSSAASISAAPKTKRTVQAIAPLSQMLDYLLRLRALSGGQADHVMANAGFREVGPSRKDEILREIGKR